MAVGTRRASLGRVASEGDSHWPGAMDKEEHVGRMAQALRWDRAQQQHGWRGERAAGTGRGGETAAAAARGVAWADLHTSIAWGHFHCTRLHLQRCPSLGDN